MSDKPEPLSAILADFRKFALRAAEEDKMISPESVLLLADKAEAAAERERRNYQRLHECFWEPSATQSIVRQMLDEADDLRSACPKESDDLAHFAHALIECAKPAARAPGNAAAMRDALVAVKDGVYTSAYGNSFAVVKINLCGYSFAINADHSSFRPHIKVKDQKEVLNRVVDELVDCINKGAALAAPARNCDRTKYEAESVFKAKFGRPWTAAEDELATWLFAENTSFRDAAVKQANKLANELRNLLD